MTCFIIDCLIFHRTDNFVSLTSEFKYMLHILEKHEHKNSNKTKKKTLRDEHKMILTQECFCIHAC